VSREDQPKFALMDWLWMLVWAVFGYCSGGVAVTVFRGIFNFPDSHGAFNLRFHKALMVGYLLVGIVVIELRSLIECPTSLDFVSILRPLESKAALLKFSGIYRR